MGRIFVDRSQNVWDRSMQRRLAPPMASVAVGDLDEDPVHPADAEFTRFNTSDCRLRHTPTPCLQCLPWQQARPDADLCLRPSCRLNVSRSEEHTSELQSLMRISYAVFCLKKKNK